MPSRRLLARPEDVHCVVFHAVSLAAYAAAFWLWCHPELAGIDTPWARAAFVAGAAFLLGWISGVDVGVNFHNHAHRRIFTRPWLNRWGARLWTFSGGWPALFWQHAHVTVHHGNLLEDRDWTLPRRRADGRWENVYRYLLLHWPWRYAVHLARDLRCGALPARSAAVELAWFAAFWSLPFWIDVEMALWLWVLPHWIANCVTMGSGMFVQHAGCERRSPRAPMRHSNGFLSRFFNATMFNIGYHVEHHDHPGVHWADLPEFHERMRAHLIAHGAHYVPYGYYGAARRLTRLRNGDDLIDEFAADHAPGFAPPADRDAASDRPAASA